MDTVLYFLSLPESGLFTYDLRSGSPWSADPWYCSAVWCLLLLCNGNCVTYNVGVDQCFKLDFMRFVDCFKQLWLE